MTVFKRGSVWWYDFRWQRQRLRESTKATTKAEALVQESLRRSELSRGMLPKVKLEVSPRFSEFASAEFANWCANEHRDQPKTYQRYMCSIRASLEFFGTQTLNSITSGAIERFKLARSKQVRKHSRDGRLVTPAAVNRDLAALRVLFGLAMRLHYVDKNPVKEVKLFREGIGSLRVIAFEEQSKYLECASPVLRDIAIIMLETGMRPGEIYKLRRDDLDVELPCIHIRRGKTAYARRSIPLTTQALSILSARVESSTTEWIFASPAHPSRPLGDIRKAHEAAVAKADISPPFRLYDLRHTALSRMAMAGIDLSTLKELAGHSQIQMTMRYVHPTSEHKRLAIAKFETFNRAQNASCGEQASKGPWTADRTAY